MQLPASLPFGLCPQVTSVLVHPEHIVCRTWYLLVSMNRQSEEAVGPGKGSPIAWLSHSIFSLILNKSFVVVVCLIVCFKLTTWKKSLGYLWFSCSVPVPSPLE